MKIYYVKELSQHIYVFHKIIVAVILKKRRFSRMYYFIFLVLLSYQ